MKRILKWAGIGCGGFVLLIIAIGIIGALANGGNPASQPAPSAASPLPSSAAKAEPRPTNTPKPQPTAVPVPGIGEVVSKGNWEYTVTKAEQTKTLIWSQFGNKTDAKGIWQVVYLTVKNAGKETYTLNTWDFEIHDAADIKYKTDTTSLSFADFKKLSKPFDSFPPGVKADTVVAFDVNPEAKGLRLYLVQAKTYVALE